MLIRGGKTSEQVTQALKDIASLFVYFDQFCLYRFCDGFMVTGFWWYKVKGRIFQYPKKLLKGNAGFTCNADIVGFVKFLIFS